MGVVIVSKSQKFAQYVTAAAIKLFRFADFARWFLREQAGATPMPTRSMRPGGFSTEPAKTVWTVALT